MTNKKKNNNHKQTTVRDYANDIVLNYDNGVISIIKFTSYGHEPRTIINIYDVYSFTRKISEFISQINGG